MAVEQINKQGLDCGFPAQGYESVSVCVKQGRLGKYEFDLTHQTETRNRTITIQLQ